jgi:toxin ParE1/3/4
VNYCLHPEAEEDLREAAQFYQDRAGAGLSQSFLAEFERSVELLLQYPHLGAIWRHGKRRLIARHFPFSVIYTVVGEQIRVLAVAHHSRRPDYWRVRNRCGALLDAHPRRRPAIRTQDVKTIAVTRGEHHALRFAEAHFARR